MLVPLNLSCFSPYCLQSNFIYIFKFTISLSNASNLSFTPSIEFAFISMIISFISINSIYFSNLHPAGILCKLSSRYGLFLILAMANPAPQLFWPPSDSEAMSQGNSLTLLRLQKSYDYGNLGTGQLLNGSRLFSCLILFLLLGPQRRKSSFLHVWYFVFFEWMDESVNSQSMVFFLNLLLEIIMTYFISDIENSRWIYLFPLLLHSTNE